MRDYYATRTYVRTCVYINIYIVFIEVHTIYDEHLYLYFVITDRL